MCKNTTPEQIEMEQILLIWSFCTHLRRPELMLLLSIHSTHSGTRMKDSRLAFLPEHCDVNPSEQQHHQPGLEVRGKQ